MRFRPYIFLVDPWDDLTDIDSGWGNRLQHWEAASIINSKTGSRHRIRVLPNNYPELNHVKLPDTGYIDQDEVNAIPITNKDVDRWVLDQKIDLDPNSNYSIEFDFYHSSLIRDNFFDINNNKVLDIKLLSPELNLALDKFSNSKIGIHIRRGNGVRVTSKDIRSIPKEYRKFYNECELNDPHYAFCKDSEYFNFIDQTIENDNNVGLGNVKFYIGTDVDEKAIEYYKTKYPNRIYTISDVIDKIKPILEQTSFLEPRLHLKKMGTTLLDFFTLTKSSRIITSPYSSWSYMACRVSGKDGTEIKNLDHIEELSAKPFPFTNPLVKKLV